MSLTAALGIAQRSLQNTSRQTSVVSRNIAEQGNPDYARRAAILASGPQGGTHVVNIQRATGEVLFKQNLSALSAASGQHTVLAGLNQLATSINGADNDSAMALLIGRFQNALDLYAAAPANRTLAASAVEAAREVTGALNAAATSVQAFRVQADKDIAAQVGDLNRFLAEFREVNQEVVNGTRTGADINDALDRRDALLKQISAILPVSVATRADNDIGLVTKDGITLFDKIPRTVSFAPTPTYAPGATGGRVIIDGVPLAKGSTANASGTLGALLHLRDDVATSQEAQLDEMARALVTTFVETDQSGAGAPPRTGLFSWSGSPAAPAAGLRQAGLAATITINAAFDGSAGGNPELLRDGGANGLAYRVNTSGATSFSDRLIALGQGLQAPIAFDPAAGLGSASIALGDFASSSVSWLEGQRQLASQTLETKTALANRTGAALSNSTGVNIDEEMSLLLELEHSYQASARLITAVDEMLRALLAAVR